VYVACVSKPADRPKISINWKCIWNTTKISIDWKCIWNTTTQCHFRFPRNNFD
jgi:hypothetical protein